MWWFTAADREQRARGETEGAAGRLQTREGRLGGKQEVARAASAVATELLRGEGEEDDRVEEVGWAGQLRWAARWARAPGKCPGECFPLFVFLFYF